MPSLTDYSTPVDETAIRSTSKLLSLILRHQPEKFGVWLDREGWTDVAALLDALAHAGRLVSRRELEGLVRTSDKQRFALSPDGLRIRAQQGHSVRIELDYPPATPPAILFHGTVAGALASIRNEGLTPRGRHHVHLSPTRETARSVGTRRGVPIVLTIRSGEMAVAGVAFFLTPNGVWLTERVAPSFIVFPQ
jgi:putative RNA 2'-phosphotransferase